MDYPPREYVQPTPLYHAALLNLCGVAKWLVNTCSQDINAYGGDYGTPLHAASSTGSLEVVQYLLMCNADDNQVSYDHTLFYVVSEGGQVLVPGLLEVGPDINSRDKKGRTPLHVIEQGGEDVALLLLEHGADPAVRDDNGQTPLHVASSSLGSFSSLVSMSIRVTIKAGHHSTLYNGEVTMSLYYC